MRAVVDPDLPYQKPLVVGQEIHQLLTRSRVEQITFRHSADHFLNELKF